MGLRYPIVECRRLATSGRGSRMVGYNVQAAVDTTNHLIVAHEVTNVGTDKSHLADMANQAKVALEAENLRSLRRSRQLNLFDRLLKRDICLLFLWCLPSLGRWRSVLLPLHHTCCDGLAVLVPTHIFGLQPVRNNPTLFTVPDFEQLHPMINRFVVLISIDKAGEDCFDAVTLRACPAPR